MLIRKQKSEWVFNKNILNMQFSFAYDHYNNIFKILKWSILINIINNNN